MDSDGAMIWAWRHPRPDRVDGYCIGRADVPVDPRRAKRLARRIERAARVHGLPREVWTSPLQRCAEVGRWLKRWGWMHHVDAALLEMDFGAWDGLPWSVIACGEVEAWRRDFARHAPGKNQQSRIGRKTQFRAQQWIAARRMKHLAIDAERLHDDAPDAAVAQALRDQLTRRLDQIETHVQLA